MAIGSPQWMYASGEDFTIDQSLRFEDTAKNGTGSYLTKTPTSAGNSDLWTYSCWAKGLPAPNADSHETQMLLGVDGDDSNDYYLFLCISNDGTFDFRQIDSGGYDFRKISTALYRDPSSWYHFMVAYDSANVTAEDRIKMYVNGERITSFGTNENPDSGKDAFVNKTKIHAIGRFAYNGDLQEDGALNGYLAEVHLIDGTALTPTSFGETGDYGEWKPKEVSGLTYGTNGFYLPFKQDYTVEGFSATTYGGNGATNHYIGGTGFQPDLLWVKKRSASGTSHMINDSVRGAGRTLYGNLTNAESALSTSNITAFNTDGFSLGTGGSVNDNGSTFIAWSWDMGGSNATNTDGSITSTVRASTTYGQSIVTYTGTGSAATVGHGLDSAPNMIILKCRSDAGGDWKVQHTGLTDGDKVLYLNDSVVEQDESDKFGAFAGATTFPLNGSHASVNGSSKTYVAYCFHDVTGYSKFGSYTGDGSSSKQITTGFKPAFVMIKNVDTAYRWYMLDNTRDPSNPAYHRLFANNNDSESTNSNILEFNDTGFNLITSDSEVNKNNDTMIYMAFADNREYAYWLDQSGNNNDWTSVNLTESDISVDSPTNNFATLNPIAGGTNATISEGNLKKVGTSSSFSKAYCTIPITSGKWYMELCAVNVANNSIQVGVTSVNPIRSNSNQNGEESGTSFYGLYNSGRSGGYIFNDASATNSLTRANDNDIVGIAFDADAGNVKYYINNTLVGSSSGYSPTNVSGTFWFCLITRVDGSDAGSSVINFGQDSSFAGNKTAQGNQDDNDIGDFYYEPPTDFLALCTSNLPAVAVTPSEHFNTVLWSGDGASDRAITGLDFQPDFVWTKNRGYGHHHGLFDSIRGATNILFSDDTLAEADYNSSLTAFNSNGFQIGNDGAINNSSYTYVAWNWKANGSGSSNTDGSINTTATSANVDAGFSIVSYTGTGSNATVGHGLSVTPEMIIVKNREDAGMPWLVYHADNTSAPETDYLLLNTTAATTDYHTAWNDTAPTSSVFSVGTADGTNQSSDGHIAYCFHSVDGYSKVGSYTGNANADGTFIYTGFRPKFVMIKGADIAQNWFIHDSERSPYNEIDGETLRPDLSNAESSSTAGNQDFLSNGFKLRMTDDNYNGSGNTYIYIAFAETPFKYSNAR